MISKNKLSILLSKLEDWERPKVEQEQYSTPGNIAADVLWNAFMNKDIENKTIIDAACGPGFLGIGCLALSAKKVYFIDKSIEAINIAKKNLCFGEDKLNTKFDADFIIEDIEKIKLKADVVIQNPPFGTKKRHADKVFLLKAFESAPVVYSFHKLATKKFIETIAKDNNFKITHLHRYDFPLKATQKFHEKPVKIIKVGCWRFEKVNSDAFTII